jgi:hypothetical protein
MFDDKFFDAVGLGDYTPEQKLKLSQQLSELVQGRIAQRLSGVLTDEQSEQFANLIDADKEAEAFAYLETAYPEYPNLVAEETARAMNELQSDMESIARVIDEERGDAAGSDLPTNQDHPQPPQPL